MKEKKDLFWKYRADLHEENGRAAYEFESLIYAIMARLGLDEPDALELACALVIAG